MRQLGALPGWLLTVLWLGIPVVAISVLVLTLTGDDDPSSAGGEPAPLSSSDTDVQTAALVQQRESAGIEDCPQPTGEPVEGGLPEVTLPCLGGSGEVQLAGVRGPVVVNLWAQWCEPCRAELPLLQQLHEEQTQVAVLGIDFNDQRPERALDLFDQSGVTYSSLADVDGALRVPLRLTGLPVTLFVDDAGRIVGTRTGPFASYADLTDAVRQYFGPGGW